MKKQIFRSIQNDFSTLKEIRGLVDFVEIESQSLQDFEFKLKSHGGALLVSNVISIGSFFTVKQVLSYEGGTVCTITHTFSSDGTKKMEEIEYENCLFFRDIGETRIRREEIYIDSSLCKTIGFFKYHQDDYPAILLLSMGAGFYTIAHEENYASLFAEYIENEIENT